MTYPSITFNVLLRALLRHWKVLLLCTALGIAIGFGGAAAFAGKGTAAPSGTAEPLSELDFSAIAEDRSYYSAMLTLVTSSYAESETYLNALLGDASLSAAQKDLLTEQKDQLEAWNTSACQPLAARSARLPVLVPLSLLDEEIQELEQKLHTNQLNLLSAEAAVELLKTMQPPAVDNETSLTYYNILLTRAVEYGDIRKQIQSTQETLRELMENREEICAQIQEFDRDLTAAIAQLRSIRQSISDLAASICRENALILTAYPTVPGTLDPILSHGHAEAGYEENFRIIVLLSSLIGLGLGMFLAVCKGAKSASLSPEHTDGNDPE